MAAIWATPMPGGRLEALDLECPIHGVQREEEMVRLPSGNRICPACYKEALHE